LSLAENAAKEALEEAGIVGAVASRSSGTFRTTKRIGGGVITIEVWVYLLRVTGVLEDWPEKRQRRIKWVSCSEAAQLLREPLLRHLCLQLNEVHGGPLLASGRLAGWRQQLRQALR
jgi:8-oxo-dGTP pyrophosphatase MutT (NUDIX family)